MNTFELALYALSTVRILRRNRHMAESDEVLAREIIGWTKTKTDLEMAISCLKSGVESRTGNTTILMLLRDCDNAYTFCDAIVNPPRQPAPPISRKKKAKTTRATSTQRSAPKT